MRSVMLIGALCLLMLQSCAHKDRSASALERLRSTRSSLPGLSVEQAVEQLVRDLQSMRQVGAGEGRWYANRAIEIEDREVYKVGYEYRHGGRSTRFGWLYDYRTGQAEPLTGYARQIQSP